jgi:hypothetical protein
MITSTDFDTAYDYLRLHHAGNEFYRSLFEQFERRGSLSEKQILAVLRGIERDRERASAPTSEPVTEAGMYKNERGVYRVKEGNTGNLYAKKFYPEGRTKSERFIYERGAIFSLSPEHRMTVAEVVEIGAEFGMCCVCGRELTDAKSVERGIGPVCIKRI